MKSPSTLQKIFSKFNRLSTPSTIHAPTAPACTTPPGRCHNDRHLAEGLDGGSHGEMNLAQLTRLHVAALDPLLQALLVHVLEAACSGDVVVCYYGDVIV